MAKRTDAVAIALATSWIAQAAPAWGEVPRAIIHRPDPDPPARDPVQERIDAYREANRARNAGIALVSAGSGFTPLGIYLMYGSLRPHKSGDPAGSGTFLMPGTFLTVMGGFSLLLGMPLLVGGVQGMKANRPPKPSVSLVAHPGGAGLRCVF